MYFNFEWNNGLIFGIAHDVIYCVKPAEDAPDFDEEPDSMIVVYLGLFNVSVIFDKDKEDDDGGTPLKNKEA
jgi:hypothetical protein